MANTFKNAALANVNNSAYDTLYTAPSATQTVILGLAIQLLENVSIPANTTLETLAGQKYILEAADSLKVQAGTGSALDVVLGLMEKA